MSSSPPSRRADFYDHLVLALPDDAFVFMNHGYAEGRDDFSWVPPRLHRLRYSANLVHRALRNVALDGQRVLDVGCGRGGAASLLAEQTGCRRITGVDFCAGAIAFCSRVHRHPKLGFAIADAQRLPFADEAFDVLLNLESSHCYPDLPRFLAEAHRVLRPDGTMIYADVLARAAGAASPLPARSSELTSAGFEIVAHDDITQQVARASFAAFEEQARFFAPAISAAPVHADFLLGLFKNVTIGAFAGYSTGAAQYGLWQLRRRERR